MVPVLDLVELLYYVAAVVGVVDYDTVGVHSLDTIRSSVLVDSR